MALCTEPLWPKIFTLGLSNFSWKTSIYTPLKNVTLPYPSWIAPNTWKIIPDFVDALEWHCWCLTVGIRNQETLLCNLCVYLWDINSVCSITWPSKCPPKPNNKNLILYYNVKMMISFGDKYSFWDQRLHSWILIIHTI